MAAVALPSSPLNTNPVAPNASSSATGSKPVNSKAAQGSADGAARSFARELHQAVDGEARAKADQAQVATDAAQDEDTRTTRDEAAGTATPGGHMDPASMLPGWSPVSAERLPAADGKEGVDAEAGATDALGGVLPKGGERHLRLARDKAAAAAEAGAAGDRLQRAETGAAREQAGVADAGHTAAITGAAADSSAFATENKPAAGNTHELAALHAAGPGHATQAGAGSGLSSTPSASAAAPFEAQLSAALGSPEFAPALGVQLSILAKEGVQEARLHLNPADMGPIAVQIAVDGQHARVHFQADLAATRDALQASLPDLASAMREAGLMLAGGDVSGGGAHGGGEANGSGGTAAAGRDTGNANEAAPGMAAAPRKVRTQGVVDLYA